MDQEIKYFEFIKELDYTLPLNTSFDYTTLSPSELVNRVMFLLKRVGVHLSEEKIKEVSSTLTQMQNRVFEERRVDEPDAIEHDFRRGFDQDNINVKLQAIRMREYVTNLVLEEKNYAEGFASFGPEEVEVGYSSKMGTHEQVSSALEKEKVSDYIHGLLTMSREHHSKRRLSPSEIELVIKEIYRHYGIKSHETIEEGPDYLAAFLAETIEDAVNSYVLSDGSESIVSDDNLKFSLQSIADHVSSIISNRLGEVLGISSMPHENSLQEEVPEEVGKTNSDGKERDFQGNEIESKEKHDDDTLEPECDKVTEETEYDKLIAKYERIQKVVDRNKEIISRISELKKEIASLEEEMSLNEEELASGLKHGV